MQIFGNAFNGKNTLKTFFLMMIRENRSTEFCFCKKYGDYAVLQVMQKLIYFAARAFLILII